MNGLRCAIEQVRACNVRLSETVFSHEPLGPLLAASPNPSTPEMPVSPVNTQLDCQRQEAFIQENGFLSEFLKQNAVTDLYICTLVTIS